jgi:hypothetical protein
MPFDIYVTTKPRKRRKAMQISVLVERVAGNGFVAHGAFLDTEIPGLNIEDWSRD